MVINQSQLGVTTRATEHISIKTNILFDVFHVLVILKQLWIFQLNGIIEFKFNWWSGKWWWAVCYPSNVNGIYHQLISQSHPPGSISWSGKVISGLFSCCWSDKVTLFELLAESADQTKWSDLSCFYQLIRLSDPPWDACTSWSDKMIRLELLIPADQTKWSDLNCLYQLIRQNDPTWAACTSWSDKMIRLEMLVPADQTKWSDLRCLRSVSLVLKTLAQWSQPTPERWGRCRASTWRITSIFLFLYYQNKDDVDAKLC